MAVAGNMQGLLTDAVLLFFRAIDLLIFVRIILSWLPLGNNPVAQIVRNLTEPILGPIRSMIQNSPIGGGMMLDFSPIIALFLLGIAQNIVLSLINTIF